MEEPSADLGRIERQQQFIRTAVGKLLQEIESNPFALGDLARRRLEPCASTRASTS